jgi:hypothetical protein
MAKINQTLNQRLTHYAVKYYGTTDLTRLTTYQLDKITTWTTGRNPDAGRNRDRKAGRSKGRYIKGII